MQHVRCQKPVPINTMHLSPKNHLISSNFLLLFIRSCSSTNIICARPCCCPRSKKLLEFGAKKGLLQESSKEFMLKKNPISLMDFRGEFLQGRWGRQCSVGAHLQHYSLVGWWWGSRVVSWALTSSVLRLQLVWGLPAHAHHAVNFFHLVRLLVSAEQPRNVHQTLSSIWSKSFREGLKILWLLYGWSIVSYFVVVVTTHSHSFNH